MIKKETSANLVALGILTIAIFVTSFALVTAKMSVQTVYAKDSGSGSESSNEAAKQAAEQAGETQKQTQEQQQHQQEQAQQTGQSQQDSKGSVNSQQEGQKRELEIQSGGQKFKVKVEDNGNSKVEMEQPNAKFKLEIEKGDVVVKTKDTNGELVDANKKEGQEVTDFLKEQELNIASEDGKMKIERHGVEAHTDFPLSVDPVSRQLVVTTPSGQKAVTILPDQAVRNMLAGGIISEIASSSATPGVAATSSVQLEMRNGSLVYKVEGQKDLRLLGLIPVTTSTTAFVSPDTGQVVAQEQSLLANILRFLSR